MPGGRHACSTISPLAPGLCIKKCKCTCKFYLVLGSPVYHGAQSTLL